jgi:ferredoxin
VVVAREHLAQLFDVLRRRGFSLVGPTVRDGAIIYDEINAVGDLPAGWTDQQQGGSYRLRRRPDAALFGYNAGPHAWKKFLHPPALRLTAARRADKGFDILPQDGAAPQFAFIGVRPCELRAIAIQDKVFMQGAYVDPAYLARREKIFLVAVNCTQAGGTCFCASMQTGPQAGGGFELALTEVLAGEQHFFIVEVGNSRGAEVIAEVTHRPAQPAETEAADRAVNAAAQQMGRTLDTAGIKELLYRNYEHPRWDDVARRCLTCANCTMVCPTCFCTTVEDVTDLRGEHAERWRKWDSCFAADFSYIHGGSVRGTPRSRYRQWMTHKLATWMDQFGTSGCVGCGRCITWCPVAIDITEEARAIRESDTARGTGRAGKESHDPHT